jgi:signal transduction histidine kinase/ActR/RegA family two-component response regulator
MIDVELAVRRIDYNGRPALLTIAVDVSDRLRAEKARRSAEDQLRHSQKLDVLGQLTGGIAHDFNNILMVIIGNAEALAEKDGIDAETRKGLDRISDSAERAEDLTRQMLAFSRKQPLRARPTNVNDLVADTGKLLRRTLGGQIEIESILTDDVWPVDIDRAQLETSLVNLCLNARDAMPAGGRVLIETRNVLLDAAQAVLLPGVSAGSFVQITVSDTGRGILPADLDRIFEPFFTTKPSGKGSGLGLSMVYGFIKQSNGHISVTSEVDHGAIFRLLLPRFAGTIPETTARSSAPAVGGTERILVVEDNPQVRASVVRQVQSLGYEVTEAEDGAAGLAACEAAPRPFDLMLTDVVMPGALNGKALADAVAARWPTIRIVFMSGYTDNVLGNRGEIDGDVRLLNKPFRKSDLAQMIRQTLDTQ